MSETEGEPMDTRIEIDSQPDLWARAQREARDAESVLLRSGERMLLLGCGTSAFVAQSIASLRERAGHGLSDHEFASEWHPGREYDVVVGITRSGSTTEVLDALRRVPGGTRIVAVTGVPGSEVADVADETLVLAHADERSVVQTRFPTTVLATVRALLGEDLSSAIAQAREPAALPDLDALEHFVHLGSGWTRGLADEAALKVREAAQAHSESYPELDYRHGPISVADERTLVRWFGAADPSVVEAVRATGATVVADDRDPLAQLVEAQRLAVALAESRGLDPDRPRGLTRAVILPG